MTITNITDKILADAKKHVSEIENENNAALKEIESETQDALKKITDDADALLQKQLADNERRVISSATQDAKIELDREKRKALDAVFSAAYTELVQLPDARYEAFVVSLLKSLPADITGTVYSPSNRLALTEAAVSKASLSLTIKKDDSIEGGFVVASDEYEYNFSFKKILGDKKKILEIETASTLFG